MARRKSSWRPQVKVQAASGQSVAWPNLIGNPVGNKVVATSLPHVLIVRNLLRKLDEA